ncbi:MAG TPA: hypothetical protein VM123_10525 [archaeon]|nr:hypothetical protein [archaeon]
MNGLLVRLIFVFSLIIGLSTCLADKIQTDRPENKTPLRSKPLRFNVLDSQLLFSQYNCVGLNSEYLHGSLIDSYGALLPSPDYRSLERKMAEGLSLWILERYPGGEMLQEALALGLEFFSYSKEITTYGNSYFHTGYDFKGIHRSQLRTGFFYKF